MRNGGEVRPVMQKSFLPKSGPPDRFWLPKMVPPDHFWLPKNAWSHLATTGPSRTKYHSGEPLLAAESGPQTSLGYYEWSCFPILTAEKAE